MRLKKYLPITVTSLILILSLVFMPTTSAKRSGLTPKAKANKTSNGSGKTNPVPVLSRVPAPGNLAVRGPRPNSPAAPNVVAAPPATIEAESCSPGNNAADPDETVTMQFPLQNTGADPTTNLVATLQPGGGVLAPSGPQSYGALSPAGLPVSRPFTFVVGGSCGGTITATLQLQDGATDLGTVSFMITIGATAIHQATFSNTGTITINDTPRVSGRALATPYPSTINVSGVTGTVTKVAVFLDNFSHRFPADADILLVGPGGQSLLLMSDVGGGTDAVDADLTFDDAAPAIGATVVTGTFRPTNIGAGDNFPPPGPAGPFPDPQLLSVFNGLDPNGDWSLFVVDDAPIDVGSISGGWQLNITFEESVCCDSACTLTCPDDIVVPVAPGQSGANVDFSATVSGSCGVVTYSHQPGSFFPIGTTTVTATATRQDGSTQSCTFDITVPFNFSGFFPPVNNPPVLNSVKAGRAIPIKFSLGGDQGLNIFAAGFPASQQITCDSSAPVGVIEETVTAGGSSLSYDPGADQYTYVWKTADAWAGTCRQLTVKLSDGSTHIANFKFK